MKSAVIAIKRSLHEAFHDKCDKSGKYLMFLFACGGYNLVLSNKMSRQ